MIHQCQYCNYQSHYKWVVRRHEEKHRAIQTGSGPYQATTKMSVGPNQQRAPTTVSIPPLYGNAVQAAATHQHTSNPHPHVHPYLNHTNHTIPSKELIRNDSLPVFKKSQPCIVASRG